MLKSIIENKADVEMNETISEKSQIKISKNTYKTLEQKYLSLNMLRVARDVFDFETSTASTPQPIAHAIVPTKPRKKLMTFTSGVKLIR